jgi:Na+/proline symporter
MSAFSSSILWAFGVAVVLSLILGSISDADVRRRIRAFFLSDSNLHATETTHLLLSTSFSMNGVLYQTWLGYQIGLASLWVQVAWCASYLVLSWRLGRTNPLRGDETLHGAIGRLYSPKALQVAAIASVIGFTLQVGWEIVVGVSLFGSAPNVVAIAPISTILLAMIAAGYTIRGGLRGNLRANEAQNVIACFAFVALAAAVLASGPTKIAGVERIQESHGLLISYWGLGALLSNIVFSLAWQFVDMSAWQSLSATKPEQAVRRTALSMSAFWVFVFPGLLGALLGMYLRRRTNTYTDQDIIFQSLSLFQSHPSLVFFVALGFFAALLSTIDGLLLAAAQALSWDLIDRKSVLAVLKAQANHREGVTDANPEEEGVSGRSERDILNRSKVALFVLAVAGAGGTSLLVYFKIVGLFSLVYIITVAQMSLVPIVCFLFWGRARAAIPAAASVTVGLVGGFAWIVLSLTLFPKSLRILDSAPADLAPIATIAAASLPVLVRAFAKERRGA